MTTLDELADQLAAVAELAVTLDDELRGRSDELARRVSALEADQFSLTEQVRLAATAADRAVVGLDELEDIVTDVDERAGETAATFKAALQQRDAAIGDLPMPSAPSTAAFSPEGSQRQRPPLNVLYAWVADHITPLVRRVTATGEGGGIRWCQQWWLHHDAIERFTALYLVFDELSKEDNLSWLSAYLRDHLDPHLATLTNPYGPFYACSPQRHSDTSSPLSHAVFDQDSGTGDDAEDQTALGTHSTAGDPANRVADDVTEGTT